MDADNMNEIKLIAKTLCEALGKKKEEISDYEECTTIPECLHSVALYVGEYCKEGNKEGFVKAKTIAKEVATIASEFTTFSKVEEG